jgi:hypothetical protein
MNEFLNFLYNHDHPNSIKIPFDKDFGNEIEAKELVYKLKSSKIITSDDLRNADIVVVIDKSELYKLIREFNYNLDDYDMSKKPITNNSMTFNGDVIDSIANQGYNLGNLESSHNSIILDRNKNVAVPKNEAQKAELNIWQKIYKWTDHKTISIIIGAILGALATWICKKFGIFQF